MTSTTTPVPPPPPTEITYSGQYSVPMDPRGEHPIFERIKAVAADRITIVVTHRLENTRIADHIVVMDRGRLTGRGTYDDLVHAGGTFADLLRLSQDR